MCGAGVLGSNLQTFNLRLFSIIHSLLNKIVVYKLFTNEWTIENEHKCMEMNV